MTTRGELPAKVCALLKAPANVALHGSPGSGKSWIGDRVIDCLGGPQGDEHVIRLDLSIAMSGMDVFMTIVEAASATDHDVIELATESRTIHEAWKLARKSVADVEGKVVLVLDQFDRVLRFEDGQEFLLLFRELVHRPEALGCTALIMSRRSLQSIESQIRGISTLASVCYTEYLGAVRPPDLLDLSHMGADLTDDEIQACLGWSGGHPALAKYWLAVRPDRRPDLAADLERTKVVLRVLDHLAELKLIEAAAQLVLGPVVDDMLFEKQELELLGVVPSSADTDAVGTLSGQAVFCDALRHRTWSMDPWGVLGHAEVRLRSVVDSILRESYGDEWPKVVAKKNKAVQKACDEAELKKDRDGRMFGRQAPWLSYTYPGDLWSIIQVEWDHFTIVFDTRDKSHWRQVLTGLSQYRAPLAHGRPEVLGEARRTQCRIFAEQVIERIEYYEASKYPQWAAASDG